VKPGAGSSGLAAGVARRVDEGRAPLNADVQLAASDAATNLRLPVVVYASPRRFLVERVTRIELALSAWESVRRARLTH
jgi:hypothetical protein